MKHNVIIIGAGSAGLMAAAVLEQNKIDYLLLEKNEKVGKKLLISGGNRCNVTNNLEIEEFVNNLTIKNKKFLYPALYTFGPEQVIEYFKQNGLELILENNFKYFPKTNKSQSIIDVLIQNIDQNRIKLNQDVVSIEKGKEFVVKTKANEYRANNVIIATGSQSFPKTGSTGKGLHIAKTFDINYKEFAPAETHVYSNEVVERFADLQGTVIKNATVTIKGTKLKNSGDLLFTHFGLSGPVIYHLSEFIYEKSLEETPTLQISLTTLSENQLKDLLNEEKFILKQLEKILSKRMARKILEILSLENKHLNEISNKIKRDLIETLLRFELIVTRVEAKEKAYVNKGGILLNEINPSTMETKKVEGLYFIGETVDIHGPIGGFNITIAFATAHLAAYHIIDKT